MIIATCTQANHVITMVSVQLDTDEIYIKTMPPDQVSCYMANSTWVINTRVFYYTLIIITQIKLLSSYQLVIEIFSINLKFCDYNHYR